MPVKYVCKACGAVIYEFKRVGQNSFGLPTPQELKVRVSSRCPKCGRELGIPGLWDVIVAPRKRL